MDSNTELMAPLLTLHWEAWLVDGERVLTKILYYVLRPGDNNSPA